MAYSLRLMAIAVSKTCGDSRTLNFQTADCTPNSVPPRTFSERAKVRGMEDHLSCAAHSALSRPFGPMLIQKGGTGRAIHSAYLALLQEGLALPPPLFFLRKNWGGAVRSYRTFSPLPLRAVCSLWRCPSAGDVAPASRPMLRSYNAAKFEPAPCPVKFGSSSLPLREERSPVRGLKLSRIPFSRGRSSSGSRRRGRRRPSFSRPPSSAGSGTCGSRRRRTCR